MYSPLLMSFAVLILIFGSSALGSIVQAPLRVGSWNLQRLGPTKMSKPTVVDVFVKVMRQFDIIVVLEVVDSTGVVPVDLLNALNAGQSDTYNLTISGRLGRTTYKEQYAFYWKPSRVNAVSTFQYDDSVKDVFQFEPFVVVFEGVVDSRLPRFGLIPIHTKPTDAVAEIDGLVDVYDSFKTATGIQDALILGDFNAGCSYVTTSSWANIRLWTDTRFKWLVSDHADTTTKGTTCPYDRIVAAGSNMQAVAYKNSGGPYFYEEEFGIHDDALLTDVSDHYPVGVYLRGAVVNGTQAIASPNVCLSVSLKATSASISALAQSLNSGQADCSTQELVMIKWTSTSPSAALQSLSTFSQAHADVVPAQAVAVMEYKINFGGLQDPTLFGEGTAPTAYDVVLLCQKSQSSCTLSISAATTIN